MLQLCVPVIIMIIQYLSLQELGRLICTCKRIKEIMYKNKKIFATKSLKSHDQLLDIQDQEIFTLMLRGRKMLPVDIGILFSTKLPDFIITKLNITNDDALRLAYHFDNLLYLRDLKDISLLVNVYDSRAHKIIMHFNLEEKIMKKRREMRNKLMQEIVEHSRKKFVLLMASGTFPEPDNFNTETTRRSAYVCFQSGNEELIQKCIVYYQMDLQEITHGRCCYNLSITDEMENAITPLNAKKMLSTFVFTNVETFAKVLKKYNYVDYEGVIKKMISSKLEIVKLFIRDVGNLIYLLKKYAKRYLRHDIIQLCREFCIDKQFTKYCKNFREIDMDNLKLMHPGVKCLNPHCIHNE